MDWLTFITKLVDALAWPVVVLIAVTLFRQPIIDLIFNLRRFRYKELEVEFGRELLETQRRVAVIRPTEPQVRLTDVDTFTRLHYVAAAAPSAAVLEAWREVERATAEVAASYGLTATGGPWELLLGLHNQGVLDPTEIEALEALRRLRNKVAHARDGEVSEAQALQYAEIALTMVERIRRSKRRPS